MWKSQNIAIPDSFSRIVHQPLPHAGIVQSIKTAINLISLQSFLIIKTSPVCPNNGISHVCDIPGVGKAVKQTNNLRSMININQAICWDFRIVPHTRFWEILLFHSLRATSIIYLWWSCLPLNWSPPCSIAIWWEDVRYRIIQDFCIQSHCRSKN